MKISREHLLKAFDIQRLENEFIEEKGLKRKLYFDAYDVVCMTQGMWHFNTNYKFEFKKFKYHRNSIIHGLAARGWLGVINMLKSHQEEFLYKITEGKFTFPKDLPFGEKDIENDFLYHLGVDRPKEIKNLDGKGFQNYVSNLKGNAELIFKSNYILDPLFWVDRYKKFFNEDKVIKLSHSSINVFELSKTPTFEIIHKGLTKIRGEKWHSFNNYMDALALSQLQMEVNEYNSKPNDTPLPIFYASSTILLELLEESFNKDQNFLSYSIIDKKIPVFRCTEFFLIDMFYNIDHSFAEENILRGLQQIREELNELIHTESDDYYTFEKDIAKVFDEKIKIEFFEKIWLSDDGYRGYKEFIETILNYLKYYEYYDNGLVKYVENEKSIIRKKFQNELKFNTLLKKIIEDFHNIRSETEKLVGNYEEQIEPLTTFGLIRFAFSENTNNLTKDITTNLFSLYQEVNEPNDEAEDNEIETDFFHTISTVIGNLTSGIRQKNETDELYTGLSILWIYGKLDTIVKICDFFYEKIKNKVNLSFRFYCIYISAILLAKNEKNIPKSRKLLKKIEKLNKSNIQNNIGLAFIKYQIWDNSTLYYSIPELATEEQLKRRTKHEGHFLNVLDLLQKLIKKMEGADLENLEDKRIYYYTINNYVYYCSKGANPELFNSKFMTDRFTILMDAEGNEEIWQHRFYDSLGWYMLRKAKLLLKKNKKDDQYEYYLEGAKRYYFIATEGPMPERELFAYEKLNTAINTVENGN